MADIQVPDGWRERLESLVGSRRDLVAVVVVIVAVVAVVGALRFRTPAPVIAPPATASSAGPQQDVATTAPAAEVSGAPLYVHVAGAVRAPGLLQLPQGSRVADAIEAAGGAAPRADLDALNLAELLVDGAKVDVPRKGGSASAGSPAVPTTPDGTPATPAPTVIDLNTADTIALETIPGIGPVLAAAIVQHRDENGPFPSVDALIDVSGIGPTTMESVRPYVRV